MDPLIQSFAAQAKKPARPASPLYLDPDLSTAQVLAALAADAQTLPADALRHLIDRNNALLTATDSEIKDALTRQIVLLEGLISRLTLKAAETKKEEHVALLVKTTLHAQKTLLSVLGALRSMDEDTRNAKAIEAE